MGEASQPKYILGHEQSEIDRLMVQSAVMRPFTERLFKAAGMSTGMRVLDLGCGPSDVSMLAANLVGPSGSVIGIDRSLEVISIAERRAGQAGLTLGDAFKDRDEEVPTSFSSRLGWRFTVRCRVRSMRHSRNTPLWLSRCRLMKPTSM